ncbi:hypothetical protein [Arthrobacter sp. OV608]|uniref:hypothetical protein n=1 Tax=Arthrobacter sp. OV608 TaxID=1882768 RepID=UPI0008C10BD5|nr:hypothetical protein [Arthrobacter sp. OV608]SER20327.1 hypothetical protein SAMN05444745_12335 [Arthrobacter sp. OV608]
MEQPAGAIGFREVDQDGNPVGAEANPAMAETQPEGRLLAAVNPFIAVLWVLAIALLGGGILAFLTANFTIGPSSGAMPLSFVIFTFAPHAVLSGIIAIIGLLFWHAHQWQRRHAPGTRARPREPDM